MGSVSHSALLAAYRHVATATFVAATFSGTDLTTYTFTAHNIGTAAFDRVVVVTIFGSQVTSARTVSSVTIGGSAATLNGTQIDDSPRRVKIAMAGLLVPTGTSSDIVVTWSAGMEACGVFVWALTGSGGVFSPYSTVTAKTGGTLTSSSLVVPQGGAVIATAGFVDTSPTSGITWTGPTEASDIQGETNNTRIGSAGLTNQNTSGGSTVTALLGGGLDADLGSAMLASSFAPA